MGSLAWAALLLLPGCLVRRPAPDGPMPTAAHEVRRSDYPDGAPRSEAQVRLWSDGRVERDGFEREFHPNGALAAERFFAADRPTGAWRSFYADGTPRSEVDFGTPGSKAALRGRFWHPNGRLAAQGDFVAGVREGPWQYWSESGVLEREGSYLAGKRDGPWRFYHPSGAPRAAGRYAAGARVGEWTLTDAQGHERRCEASDLPEADQ